MPGRSHGQRSLVGCSPWGRWESSTTEQPHFHFSLSYTGEGNGNPLQCSCLENPRDGGAWWAVIYGVTQGQTQLKRLSSGSSRRLRRSSNNALNVITHSRQARMNMEVLVSCNLPSLFSAPYLALLHNYQPCKTTVNRGLPSGAATADSKAAAIKGQQPPTDIRACPRHDSTLTHEST